MSLERLRKLGGEKPKPAEQAAAPVTPVQVLEQTGEEYEKIQNELREIDILVRQSTTEVEKLAQRNAQLTNKLRTMEANIASVLNTLLDVRLWHISQWRAQRES